MTGTTTTTPKEIYAWCDVAAAAAQRKPSCFSRKINATSSLATKALNKSKKQALSPSRTAFRMQHEAMARRHASLHQSMSSTCRLALDVSTTMMANTFATQLPRLV
ncbi:Aste57867_10951 [Aphanomyces stellatus]|uniref:Aste57867_10951 protein n=1 Tax=Aphanomyces stellatus TaxID=120398 RepID=A0A485KTC9_9STRA|nr:hypothetical protein As57867_010911 [Aphanomyces stellatus]VFT87819.1 Aste57867_10951 [Aphanomyces stellatus]